MFHKENYVRENKCKDLRPSLLSGNGDDPERITAVPHVPGTGDEINP